MIDSGRVILKGTSKYESTEYTTNPAKMHAGKINNINFITKEYVLILGPLYFSFSIFDKNTRKNITTVYFDKYKIILPEIWPSDMEKEKGINILDETHVWRAGSTAKISQDNNELKIMTKSTLTEGSTHAFLITHVKDVPGNPVLLSLTYESNSNSNNTKYFVELEGAENPKVKFWKYDLPNTSGNITNSLFVIPENALDRHLKFRMCMVPNSGGRTSANNKGGSRSISCILILVCKIR